MGKGGGGGQYYRELLNKSLPLARPNVSRFLFPLAKIKNSNKYKILFTLKIHKFMKNVI